MWHVWPSDWHYSMYHIGNFKIWQRPWSLGRGFFWFLGSIAADFWVQWFFSYPPPTARSTDIPRSLSELLLWLGCLTELDIGSEEVSFLNWPIVLVLVKTKPRSQRPKYTVPPRERVFPLHNSLEVRVLVLSRVTLPHSSGGGCLCTANCAISTPAFHLAKPSKHRQQSLCFFFI